MTDTKNANTLLAFDIGLRRTGVAVGHEFTGSAQPAGLINVKDGQLVWSELDRLIERWQPQQRVLGDPHSSDPHLNKLINRFKNHIQKYHKLPLIDWNEAYSSDAANAELTAQGMSTRSKVKMRDQLAACLILEGYLDSL